MLATAKISTNQTSETILVFTDALQLADRRFLAVQSPPKLRSWRNEASEKQGRQISVSQNIFSSAAEDRHSEGL